MRSVGTTWLQVRKDFRSFGSTTGCDGADGPDWGYHEYDVNLALGNLLADTAAAEATWSRRDSHRRA